MSIDGDRAAAVGFAVCHERLPRRNPDPQSIAPGNMTSSQDQPRNPLHGVTLERMLTELVDRFGWAEMGRRIPIRCFTSDPSVASSLKFLRKTPWAREKVEAMYLSAARERTRS
jgi:uncharacterized protein (DUF2132 family)